MVNEQTKRRAILANILALADILSAAADRANVAAATIQAGDTQAETNMAIGTIIDLDVDLESALALYRAAISIHSR